MFSAVGKVLGYFWGDEQTGANEAGDSVPQHMGQNDLEEKFPKSRQFEGKISHVFSSHGLIDSEIYFSFDDVVGENKPSLGDPVSVVASQEYKGGGWLANQVTVTSDWSDNDNGIDDDDDNDINLDATCPAEVVGKVTHYRDFKGYINDNISLDLNNCDHGDYIPAVGDWVKTVVSYSGDEKTDIKAEKVEPLRVNETEGIVTAFQGDHGYIAGEVFFTPVACRNHYVPRKWDPVSYKAVESAQGRCVWRAITIQPSTKPDTTRLKLFQGPIQHSFMKDLLSNKEGIEVSTESNFGSVKVGTKKTLTLWVRNVGRSPKTFVRCHMTASSSQMKVEGVKLLAEYGGMKKAGNEVVDGNVTLYPTMSLYVNIALEARSPGQEKQLVIFTFDNFKIGRQLTANIFDPLTDLIEHNSPYGGGPRQAFSRYRETVAKQSTPWMVPGQKPSRFNKKTIQFPNRLPQYQVPDNLREAVLAHEDLQEAFPVLNEELLFENYTERFRVLLHLEEIQNDIEIREFDLHRVCLRYCGEFLGLKVPGLAEGRPSVLLGDKVMLTDPGDPDGPCYEGYVHEIMKDEVLLKFNPEFHRVYNGKDYDVVFTINRGPIRKCHKAVELAQELGENVLFPTCLLPKLSQCSPVRHNQSSPLVPVSPSKITQLSTSLVFFNKSLNDRQKSAVTRICQGQGRPLPYILFGPPGTGKTITVVEAILQIFTQLPSSRIIACTPSNSAADLLTQRLHESRLLKEADLVRLNALQRSEEGIPDCIKPYCIVGDNLDMAARYRILVTTCVSAGVLYGQGIRAGHFTHVFVDEAGQATEPECMISSCLIAGRDGQIVLAGDPLQLGPVLRSKFAKQFGLELSLLERLIDTTLYERNTDMFADHGSYDPLLVTKLVDNYRSHAGILKLPSRLFYHDELVMRADPGLTHTFCDWTELPNPKLPVIFHGVRGEDLREGNSPSWFNPAETVQVIRYLQSILNRENNNLPPEEIGVITPYRKQVEKIRLLIDKLGMEMVKVGSVEEFQGQERQVIIISTVRSNEDMIGFDLRHTLGFLSNPKRFNVAITRAQALLIVIGNPHVLYQDQYWRALIDFTVREGAYTGCDLPPTVVNL